MHPKQPLMQPLGRRLTQAQRRQWAASPQVSRLIPQQDKAALHRLFEMDSPSSRAH